MRTVQKELERAMQESDVKKNIFTIIAGLLFIGGAAAIFGVIQAAKHAEHPTGFLVEEPDGTIFVDGAHA